MSEPTRILAITVDDVDGTCSVTLTPVAGQDAEKIELSCYVVAAAALAHIQAIGYSWPQVLATLLHMVSHQADRQYVLASIDTDPRADGATGPRVVQ